MHNSYECKFLNKKVAKDLIEDRRWEEWSGVEIMTDIKCKIVGKYFILAEKRSYDYKLSLIIKKTDIKN